MGVGFKVGGGGTFKSFIVVTANAGETITLTHSAGAVPTQTLKATNGTATFTVKKKGTYNLSSTDGATGSVNVIKTNEAYNVTVRWQSTITATANSGILVTAKLGSYTVSGTTGSSGTTNTVVLTVRKKGSYTVTSADGASATVNVSTNGSNYNVDVVLLSTIKVTGNPGFSVTATLGSYSVSGTLNSSGKADLSVRKLGTYTVTSADGSSGTVKVTADGGSYDVTVKWKTTVTITTNPGAKVTLTKSNDSSIKYSSGAAHSTTGVATVDVLCKGTYNITTDNGGNCQTEGNNTSVSATGATASARYVKVNLPSSVAAANYSTNALLAYWTPPSSVYTGVVIRYNTSSAPTTRSGGTSMGTGAGSSYNLTTTSAVTGYLKTGLSATTKYYFSMWSYITINNTSYYSNTYRTTNRDTASYASTQVKTANGSFTVPTGWRTMTICCVGGGGGAGSGNIQGYSTSTYGETQSVGGSGAGGYMATKTVTVIPGEVYNHYIGAGGYRGYFKNDNERSTSWGSYSPYLSDPVAGTSGGKTYVRKKGSSTDLVAANGGGAGGNATSGSTGYTSSPNGGSGGSGGGGGVRARTSSANTTTGSGGRNGGNGTAGVYNGSNASSGGTGDGTTKTFNSVEHAGGGAGQSSRWGQTSDEDKYGNAGTCGGGANVGAAATANTGAGGGAARGGYLTSAVSGGTGVVYYQTA